MSDDNLVEHINLIDTGHPGESPRRRPTTTGADASATPAGRRAKSGGELGYHLSSH